MNNIKKSMIIALTVLIIGSVSVFCQNNNYSPVLKSRIVHAEKTEKGKKSVSIDSEEKYDVKGNVIEEIEYKDGKIDKHMIYEYDSNNNRIKETELDESGKSKKTGEFKYENGLKKEKYTYDADKKLISKKTYTYNY